MPKVILAGGAGFIGANLQRAQWKQGREISVIDNLSTGDRLNVMPGTAFYEEDVVTLSAKARQAIAEAEIVYFLPALPAYKDIIADPQANLWIHSLGLLNVLRATQDGATFIFTSSSHIYGTSKWGDILSEENTGNVHPLEPLGVYQEAKRFGEALVWTERKRLRVRIVRIFNTYGPWSARDGRVMESMINAALDNQPIDVYGEHDARSYCYVSDLVAGLDCLEQYSEPLCVNLGNDEWIENLQLAETIKQVVGSESEIRLHPRRRGDLGWRCPDLKLAKEKLSWKPKVSLEKGLQQTIDWWRQVRAA